MWVWLAPNTRYSRQPGEAMGALMSSWRRPRRNPIHLNSLCTLLYIMSVMSQRPPAIGAASAGLRYQVRFFWWKALPMLYDTHVAKVVVEHRGIDALDDVVVFYVPPGINDCGVRVRVDFHQVKFHVGQTGTVDHDVVIDPGWTGTRQSMLRRFCDAWKALR